MQNIWIPRKSYFCTFASNVHFPLTNIDSSYNFDGLEWIRQYFLSRYLTLLENFNNLKQLTLTLPRFFSEIFLTFTIELIYRFGVMNKILRLYFFIVFVCNICIFFSAKDRLWQNFIPRRPEFSDPSKDGHFVENTLLD